MLNTVFAHFIWQKESKPPEPVCASEKPSSSADRSLHTNEGANRNVRHQGPHSMSDVASCNIGATPVSKLSIVDTPSPLILSREGLRIFNWNCTSASPEKMRNIVIEMQVFDCDIACLQETRWHPIHNPAPASIAGYRVFHEHHDFANADKRKGGVAILIRENLSY